MADIPKKERLFLYGLLTVVVLLGLLGWIQAYHNEQELVIPQEFYSAIEELEQGYTPAEDHEEEQMASSEEEEEERDPVDVRVIYGEHKPIYETIEYDGIFEPHRTISVFPSGPGRIKEIHGEVGDRVEKDELLVRLETDELDANIEQAQAAVEAAKMTLQMAEEGARGEEVEQAHEAVEQARIAKEVAENSYERTKTLYEEDIVSKQEYEMALSDKKIARSQYETAKSQADLAVSGAREEEIEGARAQLQQAEAQLEMAELRREDAVIKAPDHGIISHRQGEKGELIGEAPLFTLIQIDPLQISVHVGEKDIGDIEKGQDVLIEPRAYPREEFKGVVSTVAPAADPDSRLFLVEVEVDNPQEKIRPGMYTRLSIVTAEDASYPVLPEKAIEKREDQHHIFVVEEGVAVGKEVELGAEKKGYLQVTQGLKPHTPVIVESKDPLETGMPVSIQEGSIQ